MKKLATLLVAVGILAASSAMAANQIRISQVYGGGGGAGAATYTTDYIEIFNSGGTAVNIGGWELAYGSATGNWGSSTGNYFTFPVGATIQPCSYLFVACGTVGTGGAAFPVTADYTGPMNLSATSGKVALFNTLNSNVACGAEVGLQDKVAFGTGSCAEGTATAATSITTGAVRNGGGMTDTDSNVGDFTIVTNPVPRNAASAANTACLATPTMRGTWGQLKSIYR